MRIFVAVLVVLLAVGAFVWRNQKAVEAEQSKKTYEVTKSDSEWQEQLGPKAYRVLRRHDTEPPGSSPLNKEKRKGVFECKGCGQELFSSDHKFESGTGWPSFFQPINQEALGTTKDYKLVVSRTEVHCSRCGGHLGHVFGDGPRPTGLRYCINGVCLTFDPAKEAVKK